MPVLSRLSIRIAWIVVIIINYKMGISPVHSSIDSSFGSALYLSDTDGFEIVEDNIRMVCGVNDRNLQTISSLFGCRIQCYGNNLYLKSPYKDLQKLFRLFMIKLLSYVEQGIEIQTDLLAAVYNSSKEEFNKEDNGNFYDPRDTALTINERKILARNLHQHELLQKFHNSAVIFALGPAGTGKTFLAVTYSVNQLLCGNIEKLLLTRPVVESGENLGFLPGDMNQKINPYMMPLFDSIHYLLKAEQLKNLKEKEILEIAPLAYMRGRNIHNSIIILDEAQNATSQQVKMLLTRLGENSKAILTGDPSQSDLKTAKDSGLCQAVDILSQVPGVAIQKFNNQDIVRSTLVQHIIHAYETKIQ